MAAFVSCQKFWNELVRLFGTLGPLWLVLYLGTSVYAVFYRYCFLVLLQVPEQGLFDTPVAAYPGAAYAIFAVHGFLKLNWFGSWVMGLVITFFCDRDYEPPIKAQVIMQGGRGFRPETTSRWEPNRRPRTCPRCDRKCADRVYHDNTTHRCLPIFDHFCPWVQISVYSRTMKAYLYLLLFLPLDILSTLTVLVMALCSYTSQGITPFVVSGSFALIALAVGVSLWGPRQWWHLAFNNEVHFEHRGKPRAPQLLAFKDTQGGRHVMRLKDFRGNPWDKGYMGNLRQVLGSSWWMWLIFWWQPERVAKYGRYEPGIDLPYSDKVWEMRHEVLRQRLDAAEFWSGLATTPVARRMHSRSAEQSSSTHEEGRSEPRRRMNRTS
ncbi:hypothetical protein PFICI_12781 [Pestalotiopsis fici W106-1]|uniref:Palmitoyltransferase n=1 Tax=Pestalotiopsis fici (strain W106-1 / CGMCC3.15140) TaxID=1229662 RepID=W3WRS5_PESFW|nr:uncharacterized protein PFICI_12781 [Pestalotiopsis fici W106-1]ETS75837.1 hypothetical protein PFICI_12781 [Pestalotiopsis fici W106-1]